jgi:hypothetical protein
MKISAIKNNNTTLAEALGQPYPYKWTKKSNIRYEAEYGEINIVFMAGSKNLARNPDWEIAFDVDGYEDMTGKGDAFKILSTVVAATKEWWAAQDPAHVRTIRFSASKDRGDGMGRTALYRRFAKQFANDIGFVARFGTDGHSESTTNYVLTNPNFQLKVNEDGKIVKGVNTTVDVKPGETQRQAAKFGNKLNSKGEPPLLNAKARNNSSPHVLSNLGLAESTQINELFDKGYNWKWAMQGDNTKLASFVVNGATIEVFFMAMSHLSPNWETGFKKDGMIRRTGEGDQFRIFATVINIIETFMLENKEANSLTFIARREGAAADDPKLRDSRAELYKRMVGKFAKKHNFEFIWTQVARMTEFLLRRKNTNEAAQDVTETVQDDIYGYKAMNYNPETQEITSGADSRVTKGIKLRKGMTLKMPGKGIFMSTNRKYIEDYYSGHNDHEVLIKFKFNPADIITGNLTDRENEFTVLSAKVVGFKVIDNLIESQQLNELFDRPYNWQWKHEPDKIDGRSQAVFTTHDGKPVSVGFDKHNDAYDVDFTKNYSFRANDEGDQFRIFATVMQVIIDFVKKADPKAVTFTAEKNTKTNSSSRIKLYKRMVTKFAQKINMKVDIKDENWKTEFRLSKNNMNEHIKKPKPEDTLGVKRHEMPQVASQHYPELFKYLADNGATMTRGDVAATELKAVQSEFSDQGVEKMMRKGGITGDGGGTKKPLIVSSDFYIIDGHHRWLASYNQQETVPIVKFSLPVRKLLQLVRDFKHTTYKSIYIETSNKVIGNSAPRKHTSTVADRYTVLELACMEGGHTTSDIAENMSISGTERHQQERKKNLQPGTDAWFAHWFSLPKMKREQLDRLKEEVTKLANNKQGVQHEKTSKNRRANRNRRTDERRRP